MQNQKIRVFVDEGVISQLQIANASLIQLPMPFAVGLLVPFLHICNDLGHIWDAEAQKMC